MLLSFVNAFLPFYCSASVHGCGLLLTINQCYIYATQKFFLILINIIWISSVLQLINLLLTESSSGVPNIISARIDTVVNSEQWIWKLTWCMPLTMFIIRSTVYLCFLACWELTSWYQLFFYFCSHTVNRPRSWLSTLVMMRYHNFLLLDWLCSVIIYCY